MADTERTIEVNLKAVAKVSGQSQIKELKQLIASLEDDVSTYQKKWREAADQISDLEQRLQNVRNVSGIEILESQLRDFKDTAEEAAVEFENYLRTMNMNTYEFRSDEYVKELFEDIRKGVLTSGQAIASFKANYRHMIEEIHNESGGLFDSQQVQTFISTLDTLSTKIDTIYEKLERIETEGVNVANGGGGGGGAGANLSEQVKNIAIAAEALSDKGHAAMEQITGIVSAINEYANVDAARLLATSQAFEHIADIGGKSFSSTSVDNIVELAKRISALNQNGDFRFSFNLETFRDLKVSSTINHIAELANSLTGEGIASLERLSKIDLSNFSQDKLKVSKPTADNLKEIVQVEQAQQKEAEAYKKTAAAAKKHKADVDSATKAEEDKRRISELLAKALEKEQKQTESVGEAAEKHSKDLSKILKIQNEIAALESKQVKLKVTDPKQFEEASRQLDELKKKYNELYLKNKDTFSSAEIEQLKQARAEANNKVRLAEAAAADQATKATADQLAANKKLEDAWVEYNRKKEEEEAKSRAKADEEYTKYLAREAEKERREEERIEKITRQEIAANDKVEEAEEQRLNRLEAKKTEYLDKMAKSEAEASAKMQAQINAGLDKTAKNNIAAEEAEQAADERRALAEYERQNAEIEKEALAKEDAAWNAHMATLRKAKEVERETKGIQSGLDNSAFVNTLAKYETQIEALDNKTPALVQNLDAMKRALKDMQDASAAGNMDAMVNAHERWKNAVAGVTAALGAETAAEKAAAAAKKEAESEAKRQQAEENKRQAQLGKISTLLKQCADAEKKYAGAKDIPSLREQYDALRNISPALERVRDDLNSGAISADQAASKINELSTSFKTCTGTMSTAGGVLKNWWIGGLDQLKSRITYTVSLVRIVTAATQEIKKMVSTAVELDTAMNNLQIVTRASATDMEAYGKRVSAMAKETAQSTKDLIDATTTYARLGYNMDDSAVLSRYTAMLQNVGKWYCLTA